MTNYGRGFPSFCSGTVLMTYEQVSKIEPQLGRPRPIMLVAPRGGPFDMESLQARIIEDNPKRFESPIKRELVYHLKLSPIIKSSHYL